MQMDEKRKSLQCMSYSSLCMYGDGDGDGGCYTVWCSLHLSLLSQQTSTGTSKYRRANWWEKDVATAGASDASTGPRSTSYLRRCRCCRCAGLLLLLRLRLGLLLRVTVTVAIAVAVIARCSSTRWCRRSHDGASASSMNDDSGASTDSGGLRCTGKRRQEAAPDAFNNVETGLERPACSVFDQLTGVAVSCCTDRRSKVTESGIRAQTLTSALEQAVNLLCSRGCC